MIATLILERRVAKKSRVCKSAIMHFAELHMNSNEGVKEALLDFPGSSPPFFFSHTCHQNTIPIKMISMLTQEFHLCL